MLATRSLFHLPGSFKTFSFLLLLSFPSFSPSFSFSFLLFPRASDMERPNEPSFDLVEEEEAGVCAG